MSLDDLDEIYRLYQVPLEKRFAELRKSLARQRFQKPEQDTKLDQGSLGLNSYNYVKFVNNHYNIKLHGIGTADYFASDEPDYTNCRLILQTDHFGRILEDDSRCPSAITNNPPGQIVTLYGEPKLENGFDRGYGDNTNTQLRQALHFNRSNSPTKYKEYIQITEQGVTDTLKSLRITDHTKMSYFFRVKMDDLNNNGFGGSSFSPTIWHHYNDSNNGIRIVINSTGEMKCQLEKGGVTYMTKAAMSLVTGTDYELALSWDNAGATDADKFKYYKNGVLQTTVTDTGVSFDTSTTDMFIGKRGNTDAGYCLGYIVLVKVWRNATNTASHWSQHFTNKLTIANIPYGQVAVAEESVPKNV